LDSKSTHKKWTFTHHKFAYTDEDILVVSGDQLYKMITGIENSLFQLYKNLPRAIDEFLSAIPSDQKNDSVKSTVFFEFTSDSMKSKRSIEDEITFSNYSYYLGFDKL
jgi:hypothetical protein